MYRVYCQEKCIVKMVFVKDVMCLTLISDSYIALKYELKIWKTYHTKCDAEDPLQKCVVGLRRCHTS